MKLYLAESDLNDLFRTVNNRRKGSKAVAVRAEALFDLLRDYAALYKAQFHNITEEASDKRERNPARGLI